MYASWPVPNSKSSNAALQGNWNMTPPFSEMLVKAPSTKSGFICDAYLGSYTHTKCWLPQKSLRISKRNLTSRCSKQFIIDKTQRKQVHWICSDARKFHSHWSFTISEVWHVNLSIIHHRRTITQTKLAVWSSQLSRFIHSCYESE